MKGSHPERDPGIAAGKVAAATAAGEEEGPVVDPGAAEASAGGVVGLAVPEPGEAAGWNRLGHSGHS